MENMKILLVEDNAQDSRNCEDAVKDLKEEKIEVDLVIAKNIDEASHKLDSSFDAAIIDLNLEEKDDAGSEIIKKINELKYRIPIAILTGTPDSVDDSFTYIGVFKKGEEGSEYLSLIKQFLDIYNSGLTRIMGGRGAIEDKLGEVFEKCLIKQKDVWIKYAKSDSLKTEKALLRYTLNYLQQLLDEDIKDCFPEEMYLYPSLTEHLHTGTIVKSKSSDMETYSVILSPTCDLAIRKKSGDFKTDQILLVEIETLAKVFPDMPESNRSNNQKGKLKSAFTNSHTDYFHWLPKTKIFGGGFLNFRKIITQDKSNFNNNFELCDIQISPSFVKDIVARFSSYYARQGQPDIDYSGYL